MAKDRSADITDITITVTNSNGDISNVNVNADYKGNLVR